MSIESPPRYNETFLESLGGPVPGRPPVGSADGVPLDQEHNSIGEIVHQTDHEPSGT